MQGSNNYDYGGSTALPQVIVASVGTLASLPAVRTSEA
jgi:hypothetical protein